MCICMPKCVYMYHGYMQIFEKAEDVGVPRLDFTGGCEPPYVGAVNWTQVLCKSGKYY